IIFIDEIDAVGRHRGAGLGGGHDEREQTLNQLLVEMDGFESNDGVILLAATNRPDILDPALLRPGRFDRQIVVDMPDLKGREQILRVHVRKIPMASGVNLERIARGTPGLAGAELANIVNEAALLAARRNKAQVDAQDFEDAKDKVMLGLERKSRVFSDEERRLVAYHEAGHALVGLTVPDADPLHKVTIIPRGRALGLTAYLPEEELHKYTKRSIESRLAMAYGGSGVPRSAGSPPRCSSVRRWSASRLRWWSLARRCRRTLRPRPHRRRAARASPPSARRRRAPQEACCGIRRLSLPGRDRLSASG